MILKTEPFKMKRKTNNTNRTREMSMIAVSMTIVLLTFSKIIDSTTGFTMGTEQLLSHTRTSYKSTNSYSLSTSSSTQQNNNNRQILSATIISSDIDSNNVIDTQSLTTTSSDEQAVDEYLEFLDRRYKRLHEYRPPKPNDAPFSVWKWLHQESSDSTSPLAPTSVNQQQTTDDVLYVLGVAGLASKKLLQKHHLLNTETTTLQQTESGRLPSIVNDVVKSSAIDVIVTETVAQTIARVLASRKALINYQTKQLKVALMMLIRGPIQMIRSLWKLSDGKRTIKRTISISIAVSFIVFRTLSYMITSETMTGGGAA